ncbi:proline-rich receptor-like protein kinase PERK7 [Diospyros lotus]|uniref:proline-rich receptor-like protein kinase PERK7 n=1 Tax=Diospyros lotus TaxID=55363 RepID=UPI002254A02E|nr:proline-rich receptor-like protein kinase PERK7 [Diospyros lotus]
MDSVTAASPESDPNSTTTPSPPPPSTSDSPPPTSSPPPESSPPPPPPAGSKSPPPPKDSPSPPPPAESQPSPPPPANSEGLPPPPPDDSDPDGAAASPPPPSESGSRSPRTPALNHAPAPRSHGKTPPSLDGPSPPHSSSSKSSHSSSTSSSDSKSSSSSSSTWSSSVDSTAVIIGVAVAGVLVLALVIIFLICFSRKKRKEHYYMDPPRGHEGEYYNGLTPWSNSPHPGEHVVKLPPPPGLMGTPQGGHGGWGTPMQPQPASGSEYSSSGQHYMGMPPPSPGLGMSQSSFTYDELAAATSGFSQANVLGQGGFGYVHKGVLPNGKEVAVKSLKMGSGQGEREFQAEVEIISRVHHRHLVSLVGYCISDGQRMLVYEFVPNKTMEFHLHGKGQPIMLWSTRMRIALGSAKGLGYLHEDCHPRIIHRDIKAANILLDNNFEAMVADFGLAKLSSDNYTHVSTRVMGTFGYLAPEYASSGKLTEKSDVFSFGVMLLELITGRRPVDPSNMMEDSLVDWARPLMQRAIDEGNYEELVDPRLENNYDPHEMRRLVACAAASIRHSARRRPKMSQIVRALEGDSSLEDLNDGKAGQSSANSTQSYPTTETSIYDTGAYNADMMKFRQMVMSDQDYTSSEYGATSEYGLNPSSSSSDSREMDHSGMQQKQKQKP